MNTDEGMVNAVEQVLTDREKYDILVKGKAISADVTFEERQEVLSSEAPHMSVSPIKPKPVNNSLDTDLINQAIGNIGESTKKYPKSAYERK